MKTILQISLLFIFIYSCSSTNKGKDMNAPITTDIASDTIRISNDSLSYEIIIIEPGFNAWLVTQRPRGFYSKQFLANRNRQYVIEYNQRVLQPQRFNPNIYEQQINYQSNIDYGYEVNYLLFNYFLFLEQRYRQRFILTRS
ncbi:hypothetical protein HN014_16290 [Aquimarina sp. TRL1]|uniref:DUF6146 family protein n=1 Tax=Aquimarina sp. (strain TRL1) TaxID=2736252 RepID=UPI00158A5364|nr:DUF6146 family protein [Aquimarina sp. TRL1]QKX06403.1 hypothetical protein HN014_16290 [Aquimarina sp. TRL1]